MKKLVVATMIGLSVLGLAGCGNNNNIGTANNVPQQQTVQKQDGISLAKAIDLAKKGEFTPQKVKFEATISDKVFGDEPEIVVHDFIKMGDQTKMVNIHITDPEVIKNVAKLQEERKNNFVHGTGTVDAKEIVFNNFVIEVK